MFNLFIVYVHLLCIVYYVRRRRTTYNVRRTLYVMDVQRTTWTNQRDTTQVGHSL